MTKYTPQKISGRLATFAVNIEACPLCKKDMVVKPYSSMFESTFPLWRENDFVAQAKRAGFVFQSGIRVDGDYICTDCVDAGKATILCAMCKQKKDASKEKNSYGCIITEYLCQDCYETVPAKEWDEMDERLRESHQYDYD